MKHNIYILIASTLLIGFILGRVFHKLGLTEVLAYIFAGIIAGPILNFNVPKQLGSVITGITLAFVAYMVGLTFSFAFLRKMGRKIVIILIVEVVITSISVCGFVYLLTKDLPLSIILASLAPATAPAGTVAVLRDLRAKGTLTEVSVAIVGLDDAAAIIIYSIGIVLTKMLLSGGISVKPTFGHPIWEILGAISLGGVVGLALSYLTKKAHLSSDHIFVIFIAVALLLWGLASTIGVSAILACMTLGMTMINFDVHIARHSNELIDRIMTPVFILFFATIGMEIDFSHLASLWGLVIVYCFGRSVGKIVGCSIGSILSKSETKITKYLGIALLNQAGVAVGLAFLAAQELSRFGIGSTIITLIAITTAVFQLLSPLGTQYAVKKAGEARV